MDKLWSSLQRHAHHNPRQAAILDITTAAPAALSYHELMDAVISLAHEFAMRNYEAVALYAGNSPDWIVVDLACRMADIILLPLPGFFSTGQIQHALNTVAVDAVLTDRAALFAAGNPGFEPADPLSVRLDVLHNNSGHLRALQTDALLTMAADGAVDSGVAQMYRSALRMQEIPAKTRKITFTSGSTGAPKGVCLSAQHQLATALSLSAATAELAIKKHLCVLPLSTLLENIAGVYVPLLQGACIVIASDQQLGFNGAAGFSVPDLLATISRVQPESMILMPQLLQALVVSAEAGWPVPDSLRFIAVGGGSVHHLLLDKAWQQGLPVFEGYGLSECGSVVALNTPAHRRNGSLGRALPHVRTRIVDGELQVADSVFLGYAAEPASWTQQAADCWVSTGDLCSSDADGFLHFQGRRKNLIVSSYGRNISPEWVEREISVSPLVAQIIVCGDSRPFCVALIAARSHAISDAALQLVIDQANQRLPQYARVQNWFRLAQPLAAGNGAAEDLMTSNGRPRRDRIEAFFHNSINALYEVSQENSYAV